jgi:hypothetical protein
MLNGSSLASRPKMNYAYVVVVSSQKGFAGWKK